MAGAAGLPSALPSDPSEAGLDGSVSVVIMPTQSPTNSSSNVYIQISPAGSTVVDQKALPFTIQFQGLLRDLQWDYPVIDNPNQITWSLGPGASGSISANGLYTGPSTTGAVRSFDYVIASSDTYGISASAIVVIPSYKPNISISPTSVSLSGGGTQQFTGTSGAAGIYGFQLIQGAGHIDPNTGLYTAPAASLTAQSALIAYVYLSDPRIYAMAKVTIPATPRPTFVGKAGSGLPASYDRPINGYTPSGEGGN